MQQAMVPGSGTESTGPEDGAGAISPLIPALRHHRCEQPHWQIPYGACLGMCCSPLRQCRDLDLAKVVYGSSDAIHDLIQAVFLELGVQSALCNTEMLGDQGQVAP